MNPVSTPQNDNQQQKTEFKNLMNSKLLSSEFSDRLVPLCDGRPGLRGGFCVEAREPSEAGASLGSEELAGETPALPGTLDFIASDATVDRFDEMIDPAGWQLDNYRRNPVFQNAHQYGDVIFTLGRALVTEVRDGRLFQRIQFATDVNPMARIDEQSVVSMGQFLARYGAVEFARAEDTWGFLADGSGTYEVVKGVVQIARDN
jgi:hypothetical protein